MKCFCCGKPGHGKETCYFREKKCFKCGKIGHTQAVCRPRPFVKQNRDRKNVQNVVEDDLLYQVGKSLFNQIVCINDRRVRMVFDTGAEVSIINERVFNALGGNAHLPLRTKENPIKAYGNNEINVLGETRVTVADNGKQLVLPVVVTRGDNPCIYGCDWIRQLRPTFTINEIRSGVTLVLKDNVKPVFCRPRTIPFGLRDRVEAEIGRLVNEKVLIKVDESEWATPIVPVVKPDGKIRLCGDFKVTLNPNLKDRISTTRPLEDIVNSLCGSCLLYTSPSPRDS